MILSLFIHRKQTPDPTVSLVDRVQKFHPQAFLQVLINKVLSNRDGFSPPILSNSSRRGGEPDDCSKGEFPTRHGEAAFE